MTQEFRVSVDGISITDFVISSTANYAVGRVFNTASLKTRNVDVKTFLYKDVEIQHDLNIFYGFVYGIVCFSCSHRK